MYWLVLSSVITGVGLFRIQLLDAQQATTTLKTINFLVKPLNQNETDLIWCNDEIEISCISGFGYYLTMPAFFILIFGVQFRVTRRGITVGGWYALTIACCAILTFITLTGKYFRLQKAFSVTKCW